MYRDTGDYILRVEAPRRFTTGYNAGEKSIRVHGFDTVIVDNIVLLDKTPPIVIIDEADETGPINKGKAITIHGICFDAGSGVRSGSLSATLDGKTVPVAVNGFEWYTAIAPAGKTPVKLIMKAGDECGNLTEKEIDITADAGIYRLSQGK